MRAEERSVRRPRPTSPPPRAAASHQQRISSVSVTPRPRFTVIRPFFARRSAVLSLLLVLFLGYLLTLAPLLRTPSSFRPSSLLTQIRPSRPLSSPPSAWTVLNGTWRPLTTAAMAPEKLRKPPQAPPVFTATPTSILDDARRLIERSRKIQDQVASLQPEAATFANVMLPLAHDENRMALESHILAFYQSVSTDPALRDASTEAEKLLDDFAIESVMREDVYRLVDAVLKKNEPLDPESRRLLEKEHKEYVRNGLGLPAGPKRDRFKEIKKRLSQISIEFQRNLNEENGGIWFTREELDGVPEDVLSGLKKGEGENEGKLWLTFKYPDLFPTLKYAKNAETRKRVMIANENKCNQNVPLFKEAVVLRDEAARLLGYPNHAAFRIEDKMAKTPETVDNFLGDLRSRLTAGGLKEIEALKELKKQDLESRGEKFDGRYFLWDHRFYDRMMLEKHYQLDQQLIAEYFPLQTTIAGMLRIFEELFGLVFVEITGEDRDKVAESGKGSDIVWHEDVQVFSVWDDEGEGSGFVGYLYLDLFPREGKYGHAANFNLQPVCQLARFSLLKFTLVVILFYLGHETDLDRASSMKMATAGIPPPRWCATSPSLRTTSPVCSSTTRS